MEVKINQLAQAQKLLMVLLSNNDMRRELLTYLRAYYPRHEVNLLIGDDPSASEVSPFVDEEMKEIMSFICKLNS